MRQLIHFGRIEDMEQHFQTTIEALSTQIRRFCNFVISWMTTRFFDKFVKKMMIHDVINKWSRSFLCLYEKWGKGWSLISWTQVILTFHVAFKLLRSPRWTPSITRIQSAFCTRPDSTISIALTRIRLPQVTSPILAMMTLKKDQMQQTLEWMNVIHTTVQNSSIENSASSDVFTTKIEIHEWRYGDNPYFYWKLQIRIDLIRAQSSSDQEVLRLLCYVSKFKSWAVEIVWLKTWLRKWCVIGVSFPSRDVSSNYKR